MLCNMRWTLQLSNCFFLVLVRGHIFVAAFVSPFVLNWKTRQPTVNNTNVKMHSVCFAPTCFWCLWALAKNNYERLFNAAYSATNMWNVVMHFHRNTASSAAFWVQDFASTVHLTRYYWRSTKWLHLGLGKTTVKHRRLSDKKCLLWWVLELDKKWQKNNGNPNQTNDSAGNHTQTNGFQET